MKKQKIATLALVGLLLIGLTACGDSSVPINTATATSDTTGGGTLSTSAAINVWDTATDAVKNDLKAPSTASFPWFDSSAITDNGDGTYSVASYVDAENSFGAKIRSNWSCTVHGSSSNSYATDVSISQI